MSLKEKHNSKCRKSKDFKPAYKGDPYPPTDKYVDEGIQDASLYTCNLCGLKFLMICFGEHDKRQSGLYEWKGAKTEFKYKDIDAGCQFGF